LSFHWDAFGIKGMIWGKKSVQILVGHGGAADPRLRTTDIGVVMPCHREFHILQGVGCAPGCRHLVLRLSCHGARARPTCLGSANSLAWVCRPTRLGLQTRSPGSRTIDNASASGPKTNEFRVKTQFTSGPKANALKNYGFSSVVIIIYF